MDTCLNCQYFYIWDSDPCCLNSNNYTILLPKLACNLYKKCNDKFTQIHTESWNKVKESFFSRYDISDHLLNDYLKLFPGDKDIVDN